MLSRILINFAQNQHLPLLKLNADTLKKCMTEIAELKGGGAATVDFTTGDVSSEISACQTSIKL